MNKQTDNKKECGNCRYYMQHYTKWDTEYHAVHCGHCIHNGNKKMLPLGICGRWEEITIQKEERKTSIKNALISMSEQLGEMTMLLKDDIENCR